MNDSNTVEITDEKIQQFTEDIKNGLAAEPKKLPSKYFYDKKGDKLFQQIMKLDEYYLTRAEYEVFETNKEEILGAISGDQGFDFFELGAGDGYKTKLLLKYFVNQSVDFTYFPIDISGNVLKELKGALENEIPELNVTTLEGDYFKMLAKISKNQKKNKLILFLGSNIGNFNKEEAIGFLKLLRKSLTEGDFFLMGVDLKKHPAVILSAYNDAKGVTREFNLNLLDRINEDLGANFNRNQFIHSPLYDPVSGECRSYLISTADQQVSIPLTEETYHFEKWEPIHMEISRKYSLQELEEMAIEAGFEVKEHFMDSKGYFVDTLWRAK